MMINQQLKKVYVSNIDKYKTILNQDYNITSISQLDNTLKFVFSVYNSLSNKEYTKQKLILLLEIQNKLIDNKRYLENLKYSEKTQYDFKINPFQKLEYEQDKNKYIYINKQIRYKDISIFQVVKILYKTHKINKYMFKKTIRALKENKKIPLKVLEHINFYFKTIKSNTSKNTITKLKQIDDKRHFEILKINNNPYRVYTKTYFKKYLDKYTYFNDTKKLNKIYSRLEDEFKSRLKNSNKLVFDDDHKSI